MDVIEIEKTDEHFRLVLDTKGRFVVHRISKEEASYKLCRVKKAQFGKGGVPYVVTHDGRTIRYPDPDVKVRVRRTWRQPALLEPGSSTCRAAMWMDAARSGGG